MQRTKRNAKIKVPHEIWSSVTERGQVTIPAEVRKALGISKRGKVIFRVVDGVVELKKPKFSSIDEIVADAPKLKEPKTWDEMKQIVQDEIAEDYRREMLEGRA